MELNCYGKENMKSFERVISHINIHCDVILLGNDYTVLLYGGDLPHIGSTVLSIPRDSLTGEGKSATSSMLNCIGHKDDVLAKLFADKIAIKSNHTTVCICGIHVDDLSKERLQLLYHGCLNLLEEILSTISF